MTDHDHRHDYDPSRAEFEAGQDLPPSELTRRDFFHYGSAALALASSALAGCTRAPAEKIVPYRVQPNGVVPGRAAHYATASTIDGYATGILVESHEGRPTKVEGNREHPSSRGASSAFEQALLLELYDPTRLRSVTRRNSPVSETQMLAALRGATQLDARGRGLHLVLSPTSSPLISSQISELLLAMPEARVHFHAPVSRVATWQGAQRALGSVLETRVALERANVVVALGGDPLAAGPDHLALARDFADRRRSTSVRDSMNRLYVVESTMSVTGGMADHRLAVRPSFVPVIAGALLHAVALGLGVEAPAEIRERLADVAVRVAPYGEFVNALARDLLRQRGAAAILVGAEQPALVHATAHALNGLLGNVGPVVGYSASCVLGAESPNFGSLVPLSDALSRGEVACLLVLDADIVYASPPALGLKELVPKVRESFFFGLVSNATSEACQWRVPGAHVLESWSDTRALDGTISIVQPLITPLYGGRTVSEVLSFVLGRERSAHDLVKDSWRASRPAELEAFWENSLASGVMANSASHAVSTPELHWDFLDDLAREAALAEGIELNIGPDSRLYDGRFSNNSWLLELPCPVTKLTWSNAALIAPALAARLAVGSGDVLTLEVAGRQLDVPALIVPGHADHSLSLSLGWGQGLGETHGADAFQLLGSTTVSRILVEVRHAGRHEELAITQSAVGLGDTESAVLLHSTLAEYQKAGQIGQEQRKTQLSLYASDAQHAERQWGMTIDLNACTGCSACVIACQAENSIPTVGKSGVLKHREMHWLRIDRYLSGSASSPRVLVQPMACQHCEKAPCEYVCPTGATVHSSDGLNQMVYNRCVGTRFCSNNCPYKVRRFNWFDYHANDDSPRELANNPEVTVRARGVMEKCSYCVQRIRQVEIRTRVEKRVLVDGDVRTACEQACPTEAITFGNIADPGSRVSKLRRSDRAFRVLNELGTAPRTTYLAKLENPNPELA